MCVCMYIYIYISWGEIMFKYINFPNKSLGGAVNELKSQCAQRDSLSELVV